MSSGMNPTLPSSAELHSNPFAAFCARLAEAARRETLSRFRTGVAYENKSALAFDPVTAADREAERVIREHIERAYPDHGIIGEEFGSIRADAQFCWILDPIDGTRAFVCGTPSWTTLIAMKDGERLALGVIDQPFTEEQWLGDGQHTVYRHRDRERLAKVSECGSLAEARITTTDPRTSAYFSPEQAAIFDQIAQDSQLARFSFDAYGYGLLALGQFDIVMESGLALYDYAALIPVVTGAGGVVTNWSGDPVGSDPHTEVLACATAELHEQAVERIRILRSL